MTIPTCIQNQLRGIGPEVNYSIIDCRSAIATA